MTKKTEKNLKNNSNIDISVTYITSPRIIQTGLSLKQDDERGPFTIMNDFESNGEKFWRIRTLVYFDSRYTAFEEPDASVDDTMYRNTIPLYAIQITPKSFAVIGDNFPLYTLWEFFIEVRHVDFRAGIHLIINDPENRELSEDPRSTVIMSTVPLPGTENAKHHLGHPHSVINCSAREIKKGITALPDDEKGPFSKMDTINNPNGEPYIWKLCVLAYFNSEFTDFTVSPGSGEDPLSGIKYRNILPLYRVEITPGRKGGPISSYTLWEFTIDLNYEALRSGVYLVIDERIDPGEPKRGTTTMPQPIDP